MNPWRAVWGYGLLWLAGAVPLSVLLAATDAWIGLRVLMCGYSFAFMRGIRFGDDPVGR